MKRNEVNRKQNKRKILITHSFFLYVLVWNKISWISIFVYSFKNAYFGNSMYYEILVPILSQAL